MNITENMQLALLKTNIVPRWMFWVSARNRATGAQEKSGIWNGSEPLTIVIDGETRTYGAAGAMLKIPNFEYSSDLSVKQQTLTLSGLSPEIIQLVKGYDAKFAPVELHLVLLDIDTNEVVGHTRAFSGWIDGAPIKDNQTESTVSLNMVTTARAGTKSLHLKQSNQAQQLKDPTDKGRAYAAVAPKVKYSWGGYNDLVPRFNAPKPRNDK